MTTDPCVPLPGARLPQVADSDAPDTRRRHALRRTRPPAITALLLDVGGVVIPTLFESVSLSTLPSGPFPTFGPPDAEYAQVQAGHLAERDYWNRLGKRCPDLDIGALWRRCSVVRAEVTELIERIDGRVRLVAFTNDMEYWFGSDWMRRFPIMRWFDTVLEGAVLGVLKPEPEAFRLAATTLGEDPARCLFVDDLPTNLRGAAAIGMRTELFNVQDPGGSMARIATVLGLPPFDGPRRIFSVPRNPVIWTASR